MGYKKRWSPPTMPVNNNLGAWKLLFKDLHTNLVAAGLEQTATAGQLDIDSVAVLPANNTWAGFIEYVLDDALRSTAPIGLRLEFGVGTEGLNSYTYGPNERDSRRAYAPFIRAKVTFNGSQETSYFGYPQSFFNTSNSNSNASAITTTGQSFICNSAERGFFGVAYGVSSRNNPYYTSGNHVSTAIGTYIGSTFTLFIQRTLSDTGEPTAEGVALYYTGLNIQYTKQVNIMTENPREGGNNWLNGKNDIAYSDFLPSHADAKSRSYAAIIGSTATVRNAGDIGVLDKIYYSKPVLTPHRYIYATHKDAIGEFNEVPVDVGGEQLNFVSLGNGTSLMVDEHTNNRSTILMLFDEE